MTALRLLHLANHGSRNIGNAALISGLERVLAEDLPRELVFVPEPWDRYSAGERSFDEAFVERVNRDADVLLVGAAVCFDGLSRYRNTGFRFDLPLELLARIERPIVFYGLSYRTWLGREYANLDALRRALDALLGSDGVLFSVRNDGTKEWLESVVGSASERIRTVPDPGVFVPTEASWHPELDEGRVNVLVAPNVEHEHVRYGGRPPEVAGRFGWRLSERRRFGFFGRPRDWLVARGRFVRGLAGALDRLARDHDLNVVFCAHDAADEQMSYELFTLASDAVKQRSAFASASLPTSRGAYFYDLYAKAQLVLGMRIHSMNPAVGIGTPVVPLVSQARMNAFMADAGLADLCVEVRDPDVGEKIFGAAARALERPAELRERLARAAADLRERTRRFDADVAAFVGA